MRRRHRPAFTLFHLLIILAFLLIILALLLPAIQKVRMAAARAQSMNNLRQLGIATFNHLDAHTAFPAGVDKKQLSALFHLLPYIEEDNVYNSADKTKTVDDKANAKARSHRIKVFTSPLDPIEQPNPKWGATSYMGNAGSKASLKDNDGIFYQDSAIKITDITDGTSNTLLFIETLKGDGGKKAVSVSRQHVRLGSKALKGIKDDAGVKDFKADKNIVGDRGASWMDGRFLQSTINSTRKVNDSRPDVDCGGDGGLSGPRSDLQVIIVGICDGSVRSVSRSISHDTWKAACTRNGGDVLGADW